jgi:hypothetical protein
MPLLKEKRESVWNIGSGKLSIEKYYNTMMRTNFFIFLLIFVAACKPQNKPVETEKKTAQENTVTDSIIKINSDSINNIKKDSIMNERYDYESTNGGKRSVYVEENGWLIYKSSMLEGGAFYSRYPPPPEFYVIGKEFYSNGNIKYEISMLGRYLLINTSRYYDEDGCLVKEVNENKKFGVIKPKHILGFLEKEGWINLKTGKGRATFEFEKEYPNNPNTTKCVFELHFEPVGESYYIKDNKVPVWVVRIPHSPRDYRTEEILYIIDGETGKVLKKEKTHVFKPI